MGQKSTEEDDTKAATQEKTIGMAKVLAEKRVTSHKTKNSVEEMRMKIPSSKENWMFLTPRTVETSMCCCAETPAPPCRSSSRTSRRMS